MTRKDYQLIAEVFARSTGDDLAKILAENLADKLEQDNPRFDKARFLTACGVK
jgi:hypothetical protein